MDSGVESCRAAVLPCLQYAPAAPTGRAGRGAGCTVPVGSRKAPMCRTAPLPGAPWGLKRADSHERRPALYRCAGRERPRDPVGFLTAGEAAAVPDLKDIDPGGR